MWRHGISFVEEVQLGNRTNTILTTVSLFPFLVALLFLSVMIMSDSNKTTHCILLSLKYSSMVQEIYTCILADAFIQSDLQFRKYIFYQYVHIVSYCWLHKVWFFRLQIQDKKTVWRKTWQKVHASLQSAWHNHGQKGNCMVRSSTMVSWAMS